VDPKLTSKIMLEPCRYVAFPCGTGYRLT
jgi:hypothetical protein